MSDEIKSGKQILDDFFSALPDYKNVDKKITDILINFYKQGKFSDKNIINELSKCREEKLNA